MTQPDQIVEVHLSRAALRDGFREAAEEGALVIPGQYDLALGAVVLAITYLSLVLGELVPKQIAMRTPEAIAAAMAAPLHALSKVAAPAVRLLGGSSRLVLRTLGLRPHAEPSVSPEELRLMIQEGTQHGVFRPEQGRLLERVLHLGDRPVATLMILRSEIVWLDLLATPEVNRARLESAPHHHLPVCRGRLEELVGMVSLKSVWVGGDEALHDLSALARPPLFVPATTNGIRLLERFRESGERAALVLDEYGGIAGLASLNELTEALLGELASLEEVPAEAMTYRRPDGSWSVDGSLTLRELTDLLELASPASEPARTVGGLAMHTLARIPAVGDRFQALSADFEIVDMDGRRVDRLLVRPVSEQLSYSLLVRTPEVDVLPTALRHHVSVICYSPLAGGWLSGKWRKDAEPPTPSTGRGAIGFFSRRYDLDDPHNAAKLDAADALGRLADDSGLTLVELAIAFNVNHPGVTSAIIGPRTMDQLTSQLPAADITLTDEILDSIDLIVPPGTTPNPFDSAYVNPALTPGALRP